MQSAAITTRYKSKSVEVLRVLVVEDDPRFQQFLLELLDIFGFRRIEVADDGHGAIERLHELPFDFIICDWNLKGMDGIDFLKYLRCDKASPDMFMPVLFITGRAEKKHVEKARDYGVNEFLAKPFRMDTFRQRLISLFENPREFIVSHYYSGPCRRRRNIPPPDNIDRRIAA